MSTADYFAADYAEARAKFLTASAVSDAALESHACPAAGPSDEALYTDVAVVGDAEPQSVLVISSATHGVEGFAGSGIQVGLLENRFDGNLHNRQRIVVVHAVNPFGFAHLRRTNEDNIDLNRNFIDHDAPPENADYHRLAAAIAPASLSVMAQLRASTVLDLFRVTHGEKRFQAAITGGQYSHPEGLFFGGTVPAWSNLLIRDVVTRYVVGVPKVVFIDLHTGLGRFGRGEFIMGAPPGSEEYERACEWWGDCVRSTASGESVSAELAGTLESGIKAMLPDSQFTGGGLEFGTSPLKDVMAALRKENWLWHHGGPGHRRAAAIKAALRRALYPDTDEWKDQIWRQARTVINQALDGLPG